jgi:glycosyltransferase involved in cell wall biosynthesis
MKNILFFSHYFPPEVNAPANRTYEHAMRWVKNGIKVTIITNQPHHPHGRLFPGYKNSWLSRENINGINVVRVKTYLTPNKGKIRRSINYFFYMLMSIWVSWKIKKVDVVLATSPQFFCGIAGVLVSRFKSKPFVLEVRDLWPDSITAVGAIKTRITLKLLIKLERWMYFSASKIVTVTDAFKNHIIDYGYSPARIKTISNGIDFQRMNVVQPGDNPFIKDNRFILSYLGTFGLAHKLEIVIEAAELLKDYQVIHFLLIGDGADREHLESLKVARAANNLTILPLQPKENIAYYLDLSDVGLIMLKKNRLFKTVIPSKMFEYMAFHKPLIVAVPEGEATAIVQAYNCGIKVSPENPQLLKNAILRLYQDRKYCKKLGDNGYRAVAKYYNRDVLAQAMMQFIARV